MTSSAPRLRRPKLLVSAAREGVKYYKRERDLAGVPKGPNLVAALRAAETACELERQAGLPSYSLNRHIRLLTALMVENRAATRKTAPAPETKTVVIDSQQMRRAA